MTLDDLGLDIPEDVKKELEAELDEAREKISEPFYKPIYAGDGPISEEMVYSHILNNFPVEIPNGGVIRSNLVLDGTSLDTIIRDCKEDSNHSELYLSKTWNEFFAEVDAVVESQEAFPGQLNLVARRTKRITGKNYPDEMKRLYKAYVILRSKGYNWLDIAG
ncbi:hypothetical protein KY346_03900 [Candidatus Woesearchaeota archaeon]|nr:hypothetical protein [Candidatus Woesearchaeota archaeon]